MATMLSESQRCHDVAQDAVRELDGETAILWE
jgi:hypothetical protein